MRIYLASTYSRREELFQRIAPALEAMGHEVVSSWIDGHHEKEGQPHKKSSDLPVDNGADADFNAPDEDVRGWAWEDWQDVQKADCLILFAGGGRGGRHVEYGMALAWGKRLIVCGPRENVFHFMYQVEVYPTWGEVIRALQREMPVGVSFRD